MNSKIMLLTLSLAATLLLPSQTHTPGLRNPEISQSNIANTVCIKGYTRRIRPSVSYTSFVKKEQIRYLRLSGKPADYEEDHFIPLELGGSPYDTRNLWPEPHSQSKASDPLENLLHKEMCDGRITLRQAQNSIILFKRANG